MSNKQPVATSNATPGPDGEEAVEEEPEEEVVDPELMKVGQMSPDEVNFEEFLAQC
jgi:hypothetical protein